MLTINIAHQIIRSMCSRPDRFFSFTDYKEFSLLKDKYLVEKIINPLNSGSYEFSPFASFHIPKENGVHRIVYQSTTLKDELTLIYLHRYLLEKVGPILPDYVIGYRKKKDNPTGILKAVQSAVAFTNHQLGEWAVKADIKSFYDSISKEKIKLAIKLAQQDYDLEENIIIAIKQLIDFSGPGLPTGLSPVNDLANLFLLSFDKIINQKAIAYYRYGDDIFLIGQGKANPSIEELIRELSIRGLTVSSEKTKLLSPNDCFDYIGFCFKSGKIDFKEATVKKIKRKALSIINKPIYRKLSLNNLNNNRYLLSFFFYEINNLLTDSPIRSRMKYFVIFKNDYPFLKIDQWLISHIRHKITGSWSKKTIRQVPYPIFNGFGFTSSHCLFHKMERAYLSKKNLFDRLFSAKELERNFIYYFKSSATSLEWKEYFINRKENSINLSRVLREKGIQFLDTYLKKRTNKPILSHNIKEKITLRATHLYLKKIFYPQLLTRNTPIYNKIGSAVRLMRLFSKEQNNYHLLRIDLNHAHERLDRSIIQNILKDASINDDILRIIISLFNRLKQLGISGLPRGTPVNNIILESYLSLVDSFLKPISSIFVRTADDFLIVYDKNNREFISQLALYLEKLNMLWNENRFANINSYDDFSVEYLGYLFQNKNGQPLIITIDSFNVNQFKKKIIKLTKRNKKRTLRQIISNINRLLCASNRRYSFIRYYSRINDFSLLNHLDDYICDRIRIAIKKRCNLKDRRFLTNYSLHNNYGLISLIKIVINTKKIIARRRVLGYIRDTDPRFAPKARAL